MSTEEDTEFGITASADDILEVSPVNSSYAAGSSPHNSNSNTSPTASLRHRRSNTAAAAFSSSSDEDDDDDDDEEGSYHSGNSDGGGSSSGSDGSGSDGSGSDTEEDNEDEHDDDEGQRSAKHNRRHHHHHHHAPTSSSLKVSTKKSSRPTQQQQQEPPPNNTNNQRSSSSRRNYSPSEFDKALLSGVPSRGYATSFFSADSADASDAPPHPADAIGTTTSIGAESASWDTDMAASTTKDAVSSTKNNNSTTTTTTINNSASNSNHEQRKPVHRVNITTTTQPSSSSASVASVASSSANNNPVSQTSSVSNQNNNTNNTTTALGAPSSSSISNNNNNNNNIHHYSNPPPPPASNRSVATSASTHSSSNNTNNIAAIPGQPALLPRTTSTDWEQDLSSGVLPDVLMTMRQKIESMQFFDSDMMRLAASDSRNMDDNYESLKRSSQQSISAAVLVSLAHKRYERRRLAAMEIEKVVRSLVVQNELERVRAILLLLSDDYVRSTNEDARKGGVVALAACAIGLKKAHDDVATVMECRDLILASVVHACQDHSQRVRYYATESLFNVVKVIPGLAVQHFFILFEILRSLYADVDVDVRSGAELLDKKLKEVIVGAMNSGSFSTDACVPVFARFVYMRNKATKRLTLTWLQELNEKLIGAPILEFLHLFLGGIFDMVADPSLAIRQSALAFLQSVLPKLLVVNSEAIADMDDSGMRVDFDKILQSLVTSIEHPDPTVRKVAVYWMSRIVKAHMKELHDRRKATAAAKRSSSSSPVMMNPDGDSEDKESPNEESGNDRAGNGSTGVSSKLPEFSAASMSVRNSLPHVLPGILLSIGDTFNAKSNSAKDSFLPDVTTHELAEQTNACLRDAVRRDGQAYVQHLDSFIVALREELDSPGGLSARNPPAEERRLYRIDVPRDGTGIESPGWFRASNDTKDGNEESMVASRLCALHWVIVLYDSVVPDELKAEYAREFIIPIIHQLVDNPPEKIVFKSLEVISKITVPVSGEDKSRRQPQTPTGSGGTTSSLSGFNTPPPSWASPVGYTDEGEDEESAFPMTDANASYALDILHPTRRKLKSRDREVFTALIQLHSFNQHLLADLSRVITFMCRLQPPEFVFVSLALELDRFVRRLRRYKIQKEESRENIADEKEQPKAFSNDLQFVSSFVQQMCHVLLNAPEAKPLRDTLRDCVGYMQSNNNNPKDLRRRSLFHILLHSFSHSVVATVSLCLWGGAYRTASQFLCRIVPLDINLMFLLELDKLVEQLERPLFRHLHIRMLERNEDPAAEGSGAMLFETLKFLLMIIPQSTCYRVLKDRLISISRFRQSTAMVQLDEKRSPQGEVDKKRANEQTEVFVARIMEVRAMHCDAFWETIRSESLETRFPAKPKLVKEEGESRREWLGYASKEEQRKAEDRYQREKKSQQQGSGLSIQEIKPGYEDLFGMEPTDSDLEKQLNEEFAKKANEEDNDEDPPPLRKKEPVKEGLSTSIDDDEKETKDDDAWKAYWAED